MKFKEHVYKAGSKSKVQFAVGAEAKVLNEEGDLDISNEIASEAEMVLFSFHTPNFPTVNSYIKSIMNASMNPVSDVFAHPTFYHNWENMIISEYEWSEIMQYLQQAEVCYEFNKKYPLPGSNEINALKRTTSLHLVYGSDAHQADKLLEKSDIDSFKLLFL